MSVVASGLKRLLPWLTMLRVGMTAAMFLTVPQASFAASPRATAAPDIQTRTLVEPHAKQLANGLRYVLVPRRSLAFQDAARVSVRMHVDGGWVAETPGERGLAHRIEHMATDGNGEFSASEVVKLRDELTVAAEWGSWTSPEATEYFLSSHSNDIATIDWLMPSTIVNQRLENRALQEGLGKVSFSLTHDYPTLRTTQWEGVPDGNNWRATLGVLCYQLALADTHGFSNRDVATARRKLLRQLPDDRDWAVYATNGRTAERVSADTAKGPGPRLVENEYKRDAEVVEAVEAAQINPAWRGMRRAALVQVRVESEELARFRDPATQITKVMSDQKKLDLQLARKPASEPVDRLAYELDQAGTVRSDNSLPEGARRVTLANGIVLSLIRRRPDAIKPGVKRQVNSLL